MAVNKEAMAILLDVGPSMDNGIHRGLSFLHTAIDIITMILQRKMFSESKDEVALILFGCDDTVNPLADGDCYEHVCIKRHLGVADFDLLQMVQKELKSGKSPADYGVVVALDHLESGLHFNALLRGKRGFGSKRLIILSDLGSPFGDDQLETVIDVIMKFNVEVNVIGPRLNDSHIKDSERSSGGGDGGLGDLKSCDGKTPQQRAGEAMARYIINRTGGVSYLFSEVLPALSYFQSRIIHPMPWRCVLEIGPNLKIPINAFVKRAAPVVSGGPVSRRRAAEGKQVKDFKLRQGWKAVYGKCVEKGIKREVAYYMDDDEETLVDRSEVVEGYNYGCDRVPMSEEDKVGMKFQSEKSFKMIGFTKAEHVGRAHYLGDSCISITVEKGDESAAVALSAFINALHEMNCYGIVRRVFQSNSTPRVGCLVPHIKSHYECLYWFELPFAEDVRPYTFGSLPVSETVKTNRKYTPSDKQLEVVDDFIVSTDLSKVLVDRDGAVGGETEEALKPKLTFNPYFQRVYQCLQHRALYPDEPLPDVSPSVAEGLKRPAGVRADSEGLRKLFKLEPVGKAKEERTGDEEFKVCDGGIGGLDASVDNDLAGRVEGLKTANVTEVGSVTPVQDFVQLALRNDAMLLEEACSQMQARIVAMVAKSSDRQFYVKALDCVKVMRGECIQHKLSGAFNDIIQDVKDELVEKGGGDFWQVIVEEKQCLISTEECDGSDFSKEEVDHFLKCEIEEFKSPMVEEQQSAEDLIADL